MDKTLRNDQIESRLQRIHKKACGPDDRMFLGFEGLAALFGDVYTEKCEWNDCDEGTHSLVVRLTISVDDGANEFRKADAAMHCGGGVCAASIADGVSAG